MASIAALALTLPALRLSARADQFATDVKLVEVYATVAGQDGTPIQGLTAADFRVSEDGRPQTISTFAAGEFPLSVALAIDRSFSMAGERLSAAKSAARAFVAATRSTDRLMLVAIGSDVDVVSPLGAGRELALNAIDALDPWGTTSLYDAIVASIDRIEPTGGRRALVLLSDGVDRFSRTTATAVVEHARRSDVILYPVAIGKARPPLFAELAAVTGGRSFALSDARDLTGALTAIARELRLQYLLGYTIPRGTAPGWHAIEVSVARTDVRVRARDGYWAP